MIAPEYPKIANFDAKNWPKHGNFRGKKQPILRETQISTGWFYGIGCTTSFP
jgi:hypothetical protein